MGQKWLGNYGVEQWFSTGSHAAPLVVLGYFKGATEENSKRGHDRWFGGLLRAEKKY